MTNPETSVRDAPWQIKKDSEQHFFVASWLHWNKGADLLKVLQRQAKADRSGQYRATVANVWLVPCPVSEDYAIEYYRPQVEGATLLTVVEY